MNLTTTERKKAEDLLTSGVSPDAIRNYLEHRRNLYKPAYEKDNLLFGEKSLASAVGTGISRLADVPSGFVSGFERGQIFAGESLQKDPGILGKIEGGAKLFGSTILGGLAPIGAGVGDIVGGAFETVDDLTGEIVSGEAMPKIEEFAASETGQDLINKAIAYNEETRGVAGELFDVVDLLGVTAIAKSGVMKGTVGSIKNIFSKKALKESLDVSKKTFSSLTDRMKFKTSKVDDVLKDPATGITEETTGFLNRLKENKMDVGDKNFLIQKFTPEEGRKFIDIFKKSEGVEKHFEKSLPQAVLDEAKTVLNKYFAANKKAGSEIGKIKDSLSKAKYDTGELEKVLYGTLDDFLERKGLFRSEGKILESKTKFATPLDADDMRTINNLSKQFDKIIENPTGDNIEALLSQRGAIDYTKAGSDELLKDITREIKKLRDVKLSAKDKGIYDDFISTKSLSDEFKKAKNPDDKLNILIKKLGSASGTGSAARISREIERVTGTDISKYGKLVAILSRASKKGSVNRTALDRMIVGGTDPKAGIIDELYQFGKSKFTQNELIDEFEKALLTSPGKIKKAAKEVKLTPAQVTLVKGEAKIVKDISKNEELLKKTLAMKQTTKTKVLVEKIKKAIETLKKKLGEIKVKMQKAGIIPEEGKGQDGYINLGADAKATKKISIDDLADDDYITVYHRTNTPLEEFGKSKTFSKENRDEFFVSNAPDEQIKGYGENVLELKVKKKDLEINDEFPGGEEHYTINVKKIDELLKKKRE